MKSSEAAVARLRKAWRRLALRGARYSSAYGQMNALYQVADPWLMSSRAEQFRFAETGRLIGEKFGRVGCLLEIGCGEGHQSLYLQQVCDRLTGVDVSVRAVRRARRRCPKSEFLVGDIFAGAVSSLAPFDLVVGCEVIYYMMDVPAALRQMAALGRKCLVTYFDGEMRTLDRQVLGSLPGAGSEILEFEESRWRAVWWHGCQT